MNSPQQNKLFGILMSGINLLGQKVLYNFYSQEKTGIEMSSPVNEVGVTCCRTEGEIFSLPENEKPVQTTRDKVFQLRNSLLTDMLKKKDFRSMYNIIIAGVISIYVHAIADDLIKTGTVNLGFNLIAQNFNKFPTLLGIWLGMQIATIFVYYGFSIWAFVRLQYFQKSSCLQLLWDTYFVFLFICCFCAFWIVPPYEAMIRSLPVVSTAAILIEQIRFSLKSWSFLRTAVPRVLWCKSHDTGCSCVSSISKYFYFLLVPTLIYKDEYPRNKKIRKLFLFCRLLETVCVIFFFAFIFERYLLPPLKDFKSVQNDSLKLASAIFANSLPSLVLFLIGFYAFYHSGFNVIAECLRFGDRLSYKDWWNATSFVTFYRTWNILVQDWLYLYVYKDSYKLFKSRIFSIALVFIISAILHDYVMALSFGFFYPVCTVMFGFIGMIFVFLPKLENSYILGNILFWVLHTFGSGIMNTLYISEYYSRINCEGKINSTFVDFFVPRSWTCSAY